MATDTYKLRLKFEAEDGSIVSYFIPNADPDALATDVDALMDTFITSNPFPVKQGDLVGKKEATIITTTENAISLQ